MTIQLSRRRFLQSTSALSASSVLGTSLFGNLAAMASASAQSTSDYKALVCIFQYGGNDAYNTVLPLDDVSWNEYVERRKLPTDASSTDAIKTKLIIEKAEQLPIASNGTPFGLHPSLVNIQRLYNSGNVAILANVGPLAGPTDKVAYGDSSKRPKGLYSHNDQQTLWQSGRDNADAGGWGGRFMEASTIKSADTIFWSINTATNTNFGYGDNLVPYGMTPTPEGAVKIGDVTTDGALPLGTLTAAATATTPARTLRDELMALARGEAGKTPTNVLEQDYAKVVQRSDAAQQMLAQILPQQNLGVAAQTGPMKKELEVIARTIMANAGSSGRQVFFVRHDGYDTHDNQLVAQAQLLKELDEAIGYFHAILDKNKLLDKVTTFTASDFGRQLSNNGDGSDHGWGGHAFIMGGSQVAGGKIHGKIPSYATELSGNTRVFTDPNMVELSGVMLPSTSSDQYAATLGTWFGLSYTQIKSVLPNHFGSYKLPILNLA